MANSAQKLSREDLADLALGNATIAMLDAPDDGKVAFSSLDFTEDTGKADVIFTLKNSLAVTQDEGEETDINLDQNNETLDTKYNPAKIAFTGNYPAVQGEDPLGYFYTEGATVTGVVGPDGTTYAGKGYDTFKPKTVIRTIFFQSESGKTAFILARVRLNADFVPVENSDTPGYLRLHGVALPNLKNGEGNICILKSSTQNNNNQ